MRVNPFKNTETDFPFSKLLFFFFLERASPPVLSARVLADGQSQHVPNSGQWNVRADWRRSASDAEVQRSPRFANDAQSWEILFVRRAANSVGSRAADYARIGVRF